MSFEREQIGDCTLYRGDASEVLLTCGQVDALVTDPPYGLDQHNLRGGRREWPLFHNTCTSSRWYTMTADALYQALTLGSHAIVWGGQYYALPPRRGWLIWDKINRDFSSGHVEMAWTTLDQPIRAFNYSRVQLAYEDKKHPAQKPLSLMCWCLGFLPQARSIMDPFMGSGTTGVACIQLGRPFIGIDIEPQYFDIACRRIEAAYAQPDLFRPPVQHAQQLLLGVA